MSSTDVSTEAAGATQEIGTIDTRLESVTLPVSDVNRAKSFYTSLGWRFDIDLVGDDRRTVQFTPPRSECSIQFGTGITEAEPGSAQGFLLVVDDIEAAREDLIARGIEVGEVQDESPPDEGRSYFARASFSDPDGNEWVLQEVTERLPGRLWES